MANLNNEKAQTKSCAKCSVQFSGFWNRRYCDECSARRKAKKEYAGCDHDKPRFANGRERKFCYECMPKPFAQERKVYTPKEIVIESCALPGCDTKFIRITPAQKYCCAKCRHRAGNTSDRHRNYACQVIGGSHRRRARRHGVTYEPFKADVIFARAGWRCMACNINTPKSLRGQWVHNAPELDHKIPFARGGSHTEENAQCLCRSCNSLKRDRTMEEFLEWLRK